MAVLTAHKDIEDFTKYRFTVEKGVEYVITKQGYEPYTIPLVPDDIRYRVVREYPDIAVTEIMGEYVPYWAILEGFSEEAVFQAKLSGEWCE